MNGKIKNILSVYVLRLQWLIYDLKTCSLNEDPITLHLTGGDITISLNPKTKTTMNRQQAKELLPIIQAFAEGKTIQVQEDINWCYLGNNADFNLSPQRYRIKPEPKYRPFKDKEECWQEMLKHKPFGWIEDKEANEYFNVQCIASGDKAIDLYTRLLKRCVFIDGTPFGIKEE